MKILLLDIETAPNRAYVWSLWKECRSADFLTSNWFIMCWSAKWLGKKEILHASVHESSTFKSKPECDKEILLKLKPLLDEADIVIAHNGEQFDCKKIRTRFILNNIPPVSPYKIIDTLKAARANFAFTSNRLNDLAKFMHLGKKMDTGGFNLWKECLEGKKSAWNKMVKYCKHDVVLLEKVYLKLRPFMKQHPSCSVYMDHSKPCCPKCGSEKIWYQGYCYTASGKFRRFQCTDCGGWGKEKDNQLSKVKKASLTANIT